MELKNYSGVVGKIVSLARSCSGYSENHVHSTASYRDAVNSIKDVFDANESLGRDSAVITDHGSMMNLYPGMKEATKREIASFEKNAKERGLSEDEIKAGKKAFGYFGSIRNPDEKLESEMAKHPEVFMEVAKQTVKFIPGIEMYVQGNQADENDDSRYHLIMLPTDWDVGMKELFKCVNLGQLNQLRGAPRATLASLEKFFGPESIGHGHLIATSACIGGQVSSMLLKGIRIDDEIDKLLRKIDSLDLVDPESIQDAQVEVDEAEENFNQIRDEIRETKSNIKVNYVNKIAQAEKRLTSTMLKLEEYRQKGETIKAANPEDKRLPKIREKYVELKAKEEQIRKSISEFEVLKSESDKLQELLPELEGRLLKAKEYKNKRKEILAVLEKQSRPVEKINAKIDVLQEEKKNLPNLYEEAKKIAIRHSEIFGAGNFFLELQNHGMPEEAICNKQLIQISKETGIPLTMANDCHFKFKGDKHVRDLIASMRFNDPITKIESDIAASELYFKSSEEMAKLFPNQEEAMANTSKIASRCNLYYQKEMHLPEFIPDGIVIPTKMCGELYLEKTKKKIRNFDALPEEEKNIHRQILREQIDIIHRMEKQLEYFNDKGGKYTAIMYLRDVSLGNLFARYPDFVQSNNAFKKTIFNRIKYELDVIEKMGYSSYIATVQDFIIYGRNKYGALKIGPGRGSGAGSIVNYLVRITDIDPIKYDLIFERFLNPDRVSMPDIDTDFAPSMRAGVIDYVSEKYAYAKEYPSEELKGTVCFIATEGTLAARAAIRAVGRVCEYPQEFCDAVAKMIPNQPKMTIDKAMIENPELKERYVKEPALKTLLNDAKLVEGLPTQSGIHAAGVIIADKPVSEYAPMFYSLDKECWVIQSDMVACEMDLGLLKMDFLGLKNLDIIDVATQFIKENHEIDIDFDEIQKADDDAVIKEIFATGKTDGIFQFESGGMKKNLQLLRTSTFDDVILMIAAYRPGPMQYIPDVAAVKAGKKDATYIVPEMEKILGQTYGCAIYQEQIMSIFQLFGFSLGESDIIRRAMSKKHIEEIMAAKEQMEEGMRNKGASQEDIDTFWTQLLDFASYAFNKSHAAAYSMVSYYTAWLKYYYPAEYISALLAHTPSEKYFGYIDDASKMGIKVLGPDINESKETFSAVDGKIRFGLEGVKKVASNARLVIEERERNGKFKSFKDFIIRAVIAGIGKSAVENLIYVGTFDSMIPNRQTAVKNLPFQVESAKKLCTSLRKRTEGITPEELYVEATELWSQPEMTLVEEYSNSEKLKKEKELIEYYVSGHPLDSYDSSIMSGSTTISNLNESERNACVVGVVSNIVMLNRKSDGAQMCKFKLEDRSGSIEIICFTKAFATFKGDIVEGSIAKIKGRVNVEYDDDGANVLNKECSLSSITLIDRYPK